MRRITCVLFSLSFFLLTAHSSLLAATTATNNAASTSPPKITISGLGWWENIQHTRQLKRMLWLDEKRTAPLSANEIEDATMLVFSQLNDDGYLQPKLELTITPASGTHATLNKGQDVNLICTATSAYDLDLPRQLEASAMRVLIYPGMACKLTSINFSGLHSLTEAEARAYFLPSEGILARDASPYSPDVFKNEIGTLLGALRQKGFAQVRAQVTELNINQTTGRVTARLEITEGPRWKISEIDMHLSQLQEKKAQPTSTIFLGDFITRPWSQWTLQDITQRVREYYYHQGYPDVRVQITGTPQTSGSEFNVPAQRTDAERAVTVRILVTPGLQVRIGQVQYSGNRHTLDIFIRRRIPQKTGDLLDPLAIEKTRLRLGTLGIFHDIDIHTTPASGPVRDTLFSLVENPQTDISLLAGYGSYEELRGGFELCRLNTLGIGDQTRLQFIQSIKSTRGDLTLGVPDVLTAGINGSLRAFGLRREEPAFVRLEYGGDLTLRRSWTSKAYEALVHYTYEFLNSSDDNLSPVAGSTGATTAASINLSLSRDTRDNPLYPKKGYYWYAQAEFASRYLGGEANYQRYRAGFSYNTTWGSGRWIHASISQNLIYPLGGAQAPDIPVNKLFYPGGDDSIRGYREGDAAPLDKNGKILGAKAVTLISAELEQALVRNLNAVIFYDVLGENANAPEYPGATWLNSIGIGLRYHTILGPIRLEYGRNLNPRPQDSKGTLLFSVGMPF